MTVTTTTAFEQALAAVKAAVKEAVEIAETAEQLRKAAHLMGVTTSFLLDERDGHLGIMPYNE